MRAIVLTPEELAEYMKSEFKRERGSRAAKARYSQCPKAAAKIEIQREFNDWQDRLARKEAGTKYRSCAAFGRAMRDKYVDEKGDPLFDDPKSIAEWCPDWAKARAAGRE